MQRIVLLLALLALAVHSPASATGAGVGGGDGEARWLPESCRSLVELADGESEVEGGETAEALWNLHYRRGWRALEERELERAEESLCRALAAARAFGEGDVRFAETLDELGLVAFLAGDYERAEAMQGAAAAEILLALGPPAPDQAPEERDHCRSSVATYLTRLGWVLERLGRGAEIERLAAAPHLVLESGYLPAERLTGRLDWLISRYLLAEDLAAAERLTELRRRVMEVDRGEVDRSP